jgi:hypothetical protein
METTSAVDLFLRFEPVLTFRGLAAARLSFTFLLDLMLYNMRMQ